MAQPSSSVASSGGQQGSTTAVASGSAPNSNPSNTPHISHAQSSINGQGDNADGQRSTHLPPDESDWEGETMLHVYMREYLLKRNFTRTAQMLTTEAKVQEDARPLVKAPHGLLFEWWVVFWDLYWAKTGEGGGGSQKAQLYQQSLKQQRAPLHQLQGAPQPFGFHAPQALQPPSGYPPQAAAHQVTMYPSLQHYTMLGQDQLQQSMQQAGQAGMLGRRPPMGQPGAPQPTQNSSQPSAPPHPLSTQVGAPSANLPQHHAQPSLPGQAPWQQQGQQQPQPGSQGPPMHPSNHLQSQQPTANPVNPSQMRSQQELAQASQQQAFIFRQQMAAANRATPQPGQPGMGGQLGRPLHDYNPNTPPSAHNSVNGSAPPNFSGPTPHTPGSQSQQAGPYLPQPYQSQPPQPVQNANQSYPSAMPPPSFLGQQPQNQQVNHTAHHTPRSQQTNVPPTPSSGTQQLAATSQPPHGTPRNPTQQPPFPFQPPGPNASANPAIPQSMQLQQQHHQQLQQQQRSPFEGAGPNAPNPMIRSGMPMQPPPQSMRPNPAMGPVMGPRFNPPQQSQTFGNGPPTQQPNPLGPVPYPATMGTGGILPSNSAGAMGASNPAPTPIPHAFHNFMAQQPQQHQQHQQQQQQQHQYPGPPGTGSRAPTPAQQQPSVNAPRSETNTPAPNGMSAGSNQASPSRGTSVARSVPLSQQDALQSLLPGNAGGSARQAAHQQHALLGMARGARAPGGISGMAGPFGPALMPSSQPHMQSDEAHAGTKRPGSPSNDSVDQGDTSPPDPKRARRNSQTLTDGSSGFQNGAGRNVSSSYVTDVSNVQQNPTAAQQVFQLQQVSRRPLHSGTPTGAPANSPQPGSAPPQSNVLSEHAPAQMAAAAKGIPGRLAGPAATPMNGAVGYNPSVSRLQQGATISNTRTGPPSPPSGPSQKGSMLPPSQTLAPSPLGKDQGKNNASTPITSAVESSTINANRAPSSTPKLAEKKPPTPAPGSSTFLHSSIPNAPPNSTAGDPADDSSPSLRPSPSTSGGGSSSTTNNSLLSSFTQMPYDVYMPTNMGEPFGTAEFDMQEMFRGSAFSDSNDMNAFMDFGDMFVERPFDASDGDDHITSTGPFS